MHQKIARDIKNKRWGQVLSADAYYSTSHESHGAHIMDELRMLFGSSSGVHIHFIKNYLIYEIDIYFSKARLRITSSGFKTEFWKVSHSPQFSGFKCLVPSKTPYPKGYQHVMENLYDNAVGMIRKKSKPLCSIEDGLESLKMIDAILRKNH